MHSFEMCLIISGSIQFISIIKISEEAGIQILGPDNVAIWKVRVIVISTSSLMSLLMIKNSTAFEQIFNPEAKVENVSKAFFVHILLRIFGFWQTRYNLFKPG